jgi:hypothetical protein
VFLQFRKIRRFLVDFITFLVHRYGDEEYLLAIVEFTKDWAPREFGIRECPAGWGRLEVVDIRCIRRVTGYVIRDNKWYLL